MKKYLLLFSAWVGSLLFFSCGSNEPIQNPNRDVDKDSVVSEFHISEAEAVEISNGFRAENTISRSGNAPRPYCMPVLTSTQSRSEVLSDTVAYILNYPNNEGFTIVASDKRVPPILAYSDEGNFSTDNKIAMKQFVEKIEDYVAYKISAAENLSGAADINIYYPTVTKGPALKTYLHQGGLYGKYLPEQYKGMPVGCVPVATAILILEGKCTLTRYDTQLLCKPICQAYIQRFGLDIDTPENNESSTLGVWPGGGPVLMFSPYNFEQAVDSVARLLANLGKELKVTYRPDSLGGSSAYTSDALTLMKEILPDGTSNLMRFTLANAVAEMKENKILYVDGTNPTELYGHAWVINGYSYTEIRTGLMSNIKVYCDWGHGQTGGNGFYQGEIFENYNGVSPAYKPNNFFSVKRDETKYQLLPW